MASTVFTDKVTMVPAAWANDVNTLVYSILGGAQSAAQVLSALGLTNIAGFDPNAVAITGGSIDNVSMGQGVAIPAFRALTAQVTSAPVNDNDVVNKSYLEAYVGAAVTTAVGTIQAQYGTMALQNANNVSVSGGTIDNVSIGSIGAATGIFTNVQVSNPPALPNDVVTLGYMTAHYDAIFAGFGGMATQNPSAVSITGGAIDGVGIGAIVPATGIFSNLSVTMNPVAPNQVATKSYVDTQVAASTSTLGSMSQQNANNVSITGGSINGTSLGAGTPASGTFTSAKVVGSQAVYNATFNQGQSNNFGGLGVYEGTTELLTVRALGENNGSSSNISAITSKNPVWFNVNTFAVVQMAVGATTVYNQAYVNYGASGSFGLTQNASLVLGNNSQYSGGLYVCGGNNTNFGALVYKQATLEMELAVDAGSVLQLNQSTAASIVACFGGGQVRVGNAAVATNASDVSKLTVYGGVNAHSVNANTFRTTVTPLGSITGAQAMPSNSTGAFTMTLTGNTTLNLAAVDSRFSSNNQFLQLDLYVVAANGLSLTVKPNGAGVINGAATYVKNFADATGHWFKLASFDNGANWVISQPL